MTSPRPRRRSLELGARDLRHFAHEHGLDAEDTELAEFLVRQHLLMSAVAQKRDLSDPAVIQDFAAIVGRTPPDRPVPLTVADIRGTSPKVWNAWKGKLLEDLYRLTLAALGGAHADAHTVLAERKEKPRLTRRAPCATTPAKPSGTSSTWPISCATTPSGHRLARATSITR